MKYAGEQVRIWLIEQLEGIEIDDIEIPVVNIAGGSLQAPFIAIINQTQTDELTKNSNSAEVTALVQCVTRFDGGYGGDQFADRMASEVSEVLTDMEGDTDDFSISVLGKDANESTMIINNTERVITRQIAFRLLVTSK